MTYEAVRLWLFAVTFYLWFGGMAAMVIGLIVDRIARRQGWVTVQRLVPALVFAVLLAVAIGAHGIGLTHPKAFTAARLEKRVAVIYWPYCGDILWADYLNPACWSF